MKQLSIFLLTGTLALTACTSTYDPLEDYEQVSPATMLPPPPASTQTDFSESQVADGRYLVGLLGCGSCHTNGALVGQPVPGQLLAGSDVGIAYSNPMVERYPGVVYPANLTPDPETGIGNWTLQEIVTMVRTGIDNHSTQTLPIMPWPSYAQIDEEDATAIAAYLLSLPPVRHEVPENVRPGQRASDPYVHFGIYRSRE